MAENDSHKEGVSVQELENFGKKYRFEIFFVLFFVLATLFSFILYSASWSIYLAALGGILGVFLTAKVTKMFHSCAKFVFKQEKMTQIILGVVGIIVSIFVAPLIFLALGLLGGKGIVELATKKQH